MTRAQHAVWCALRDAGPSIVIDVARASGACRSTTAAHLAALVAAGHAERRLLPGRGKRPHVYVATTEPVVDPEPLRSIDAVRQVLADGPVTGFREVVRRAGYCDHSVSRALSVVAVRERIGQRDAPTVYRLREGA